MRPAAWRRASSWPATLAVAGTVLLLHPPPGITRRSFGGEEGVPGE